MEMTAGEPMREKERARKPVEPIPTPRKRIETQIHRRRRVKASFPLEAEWDAQSGKVPEGLRTPGDRMRKK